MSASSTNQSDDTEVVNALTAVMREVDKPFMKAGGSTRHYVRDFFLPALNQRGWRVAALRPDAGGRETPPNSHCRHGEPAAIYCGMCDADAKASGGRETGQARTEEMPTRREETAWLIETLVQPTRYYYNTADWCDNPNHARRFETQDAAEAARISLINPDQFRVSEHLWTASSIHPWRGAKAAAVLPPAAPTPGPSELTECCHAPLPADERFCRKCGWEARATCLPPAAPTQHWAVYVHRNGDNILSIESNMLTGKPEFTREDKDTIEQCALHLLSFIGRAQAALRETGQGESQ